MADLLPMPNGDTDIAAKAWAKTVEYANRFIESWSADMPEENKDSHDKPVSFGTAPSPKVPEQPKPEAK